MGGIHVSVKLLTDWVTIGTSGATIDGRTISADDLEKMAKNYDPDVYAAVVNIEHFYGNLGTVRELRTAPGVRGETALQARIRPNRYFLEQNSADLRLFSSMEITRNFAKTGAPYLTGVATTDTPASLGTTELHFSRSDETGVERAAAVELAADVFKARVEENGLIQELFNRLGEFFTPDKPQREEDDMNKDDFKEAFSEVLKPLQEKLDELGTKVEKLSVPAEEKPAPEVPPKDAPAAPPAGDAGAGEEKLSAAVAALSGKVDGLVDKLTAALGEQPGTKFNKGTGPADNEKFV